MARVKRGVTTHARHKKVLELAKGYRGRGSTAYRIALEKVEKGLQYAYRDRRNRKREFRALWIQRINAGAREHGLTYSQCMHGLKLAGLDLDRKVLSDIAIREPAAFAAIVATAQTALARTEPAATEWGGAARPLRRSPQTGFKIETICRIIEIGQKGAA